MFRALLLSSTALLFLTFPVHSTSFVNVNEGVVSVESKRTELREAFEQVVVKMTGTSSSLTVPGIVQAARKARDYVQSYEYFVDEQQQQQYKAVFDRQKIELLLRSENLPIWGPRRPDGIVWLALRKQSEVALLADSESSDIAYSLDRSAKARGVKILRPLMDLDDSLVVSATDVWARFYPVIEQASARYNTDFVLVARLVDIATLREQASVTGIRTQDIDPMLYQPKEASRAFDRNGFTLEEALYLSQLGESTDNPVSLQSAPLILPEDKSLALEWLIRSADENFTGRYFSDSAPELIERLVDHYSDILGQRYAIIPAQGVSQNPVVTIANVRSLVDITRVTDYLTDLTVVQSASLAALEGNVATFNVSLIGSLSDLTNTIALDNRLSMVDVASDAVDASLQLHFFWQG